MRDAGTAYHFIHDLAERLATRVQLTTDGHKAYLSAVEDAFGCDIDYGMLVKIYGNTPRHARDGSRDHRPRLELGRSDCVALIRRSASGREAS
jgi:hypothetical protein